MNPSLRYSILLFIGSILLSDTNYLAALTCSGTVHSLSAPTASQTGTSGIWIVPSGGLYKVRVTASGSKSGTLLT